MELLQGLMDIITGANLGTIVVTIIGGILIVFVGSPVVTALAQLVANVMVELNLNIIDKLPIPPIRKWLQDGQVSALQKDIDIKKTAIKKIQEN